MFRKKSEKVNQAIFKKNPRNPQRSQKSCSKPLMYWLHTGHGSRGPGQKGSPQNHSDPDLKLESRLCFSCDRLTGAMLSTQLLSPLSSDHWQCGWEKQAQERNGKQQQGVLGILLWSHYVCDSSEFRTQEEHLEMQTRKCAPLDLNLNHTYLNYQLIFMIVKP